ncbi:hypothetical protein [Vibrio sp. S11_S32]|nr:hypothetical protein [Vibrio sp. S11_S32]
MEKEELEKIKQRLEILKLAIQIPITTVLLVTSIVGMMKLLGF